MTAVHGGPDAHGAARWDFSTNSNACGPCPSALAALQAADAGRYPDPAYTALREAIAAFHSVDKDRIVLAGSASEFIARFTAWVAREGGKRVWLPAMAYGDYAQAARAWGLQRAPDAAQADLAWLCEPSSPLGEPEPFASYVVARSARVVLDLAYEPLRLSGRCSLGPEARDAVWQLWSPNKALGLTGVRGAYAIAPAQAGADVRALDDLAPSWVLGAHAVSMLSAWVSPDAQAWLAGSLSRLSDWRVSLRERLADCGWIGLPGDANFFCAAPPRQLDAVALRAAGIKLRDTTSMGLPGHWRLGVLPPVAQEALHAALRRQEVLA
ncbi:MAG: aminotransferase class I/II-fold pyridoxal phosphate-dependent enzyme [Hydrogenophaga sp.]|uniref:aminotransferase class I/II-fold pyridoxal phosphate-dependent enzyme n=2 Tax=Pseudomonadota TaxID=1224 RepID=UPI00403626F7